MTDSTMIERAREFVRKFNNQEYDYVEKPNEDQLDTLERLANAKTDFEKADEEKRNWTEPPSGLIDPDVVNLKRRIMNYNFDNALKYLHNWMNIAYIGKLYVDSKIKKEIEEFKINKAKIEQERDNYRILNEKLVSENVRFREQFTKIFDEFPETEAKYGWLLETRKIGENKID